MARGWTPKTWLYRLMLGSRMGFIAVTDPVPRCVGALSCSSVYAIWLPYPVCSSTSTRTQFGLPRKSLPSLTGAGCVSPSRAVFDPCHVRVSPEGERRSTLHCKASASLRDASLYGESR